MPHTETIDVSALFAETIRDGLEVSQRIVDVLSCECGFVAVGYPQMAEQHQRAGNLTRFFELSENVKRSIATTEHEPTHTNEYRGYYPAAESRGYSDKERLDIGPEPGLLAPGLEGGEIFGEPNPWPTTEPYDEWRSDSILYFNNLRSIAVALMESIGLALNMQNKAMSELFRGRNGTLRLLNYLPVPERLMNPDQFTGPEAVDESNRWVVGREHVDTTTLTLLWQSYPGLQIKGRDDIWRDVVSPIGGLSVHCGDLFTKLTSGVINGSVHRVLGDGTHRTSVGMFLEPDWNASIRPPKADEELTYAEHLLTVFSVRKNAEVRRY